MEIKGLFLKVETTFFETDKILRSIKMPINYTDWHLLRLENEGTLLKNWNLTNSIIKYIAQKEI